TGFRDLSEIAHDLEDALQPEVTATAAPSELVDLVLSAADVFEAMLAAYRGTLKPPSTVPLRSMIRRVRSGSGGQQLAPPAPAPARLAWNTYQQLAIAKALHAGKTVYRVVAEVDSNCPMKAAACQLILNVLERIGEVIATQPED